ncbi:hypothetical protein C2E23DRAFT_822140 [Lenzites betulinus]|nr:hypothetical protein C2E23DRAFT_822140 [Lenzites betulinus]
MDNDESADILGGRLQVSPPRPAIWADPGQMTLLLGLAAIAAFSWVRFGPHFRRWRETRYRKAMRRRHGIPDDDYRPFNVAYAAALQARKKREGKGQGVAQQAPQAPSGEGGGSSQFPSSVIDTTAGVEPLPTPAGPYLGYTNGHGSITLPTEGESLNHAQDVAQSSTSHHGPFAQGTTEPSVHSSSGTQTHRPATGRQSTATRTRHGKHALDDEMDAELETLAKKSRIEGEEPVDDDKESGRREDGDGDGMEVDSHVPLPEQRGSKRMASSEDDDGLASSRAERRDKRARKVSLDKSAETPDYDMEEDELDDLEDTSGAARGKKRDRAEAGSTFGGDDSIMDDDEKPRRHRRRRTVSTKLSQSSSRGQKRVRDVDSHDSDESEAERPTRTHTRKKRGKRSEEDIVPLSNDPLCKGRRISEEWESNGIRYKVGPNGQRLRQELVKKSRSRFPMPSDSQHPDRRANFDVYVEVWLSEEEYQVAKERHELAWQDPPPTPPESQTPVLIPESPSKLGKSLLWSSTMASRESPATRGPLRQSVNTNVALRLSMLAPSPVSSSRRISSVYQAPASPASDSPKMQKSKSYSKWEKQDLEAAAMSKIREKQQLQQSKAAPSAPPLFNTPSSATAAPKAAQKAPQPATPSFGFPPASSSAPATRCATEPLKATAPSSIPAPATASQPKPPTPSFPFPASTKNDTSSSSIPPASSTTPASTAPGSQTSTSVPSYFGKSSAPTSAATAPTSGVRNFFAPKPATSSGNTAPTPTAPAHSFAPTPAPASHSTQPPSNFTNAANDTSKSTETKPVPGGSLLSRLGMGPPPVAQSSPSSPFSFGKTASTPAAPGTSPVGSTANGTGAAGSTAPKFSFGAPSKPAPPAAPSAFAANGPAAQPSAPPPTSTSAPSGTGAPKFSFGMNSTAPQPAASAPAAATPSPFLNSASNSASSAPKSTSAFGASSAHTSSAFGGASTPAANPSPFGAAPGSNPSPFAAAGSSFTSSSNSSPFGAPTNGTSSTPAGAPKSAFSFGASTASSAAAKPAETSKSAFSSGSDTTSSSSSPFFGGGASQNTTTPKTDIPGLKPAFGFTSSTTPKFGAPSTSAAFGATSTPGASDGSKATFAFGGNGAASSFTTTPASTTGKPSLSFNFGAPSAGTSSTTPAASTPSSFGFGATPSSGNAATPAASSPFGAPPASQPGASSFGFGASSGAFSFGSSVGQNAQK